MRAILILWFLPIAFFWGWYGLSAYDINFGNIFLSRAFHDHMFGIYGSILGMPAEDVPAKIAAVFAFDSSLVLAIAAFRWRKSWYPQTAEWISINVLGQQSSADQGPLIIDYSMGEPVTSVGSTDQGRPAK